MSTQKINDIDGFIHLNMERLTETITEKSRLRDEAQAKVDTYQRTINRLVPIKRALQISTDDPDMEMRLENTKENEDG